jgi:hypothetical protein
VDTFNFENPPQPLSKVIYLAFYILDENHHWKMLKQNAPEALTANVPLCDHPLCRHLVTFCVKSIFGE